MAVGAAIVSAIVGATQTGLTVAAQNKQRKEARSAAARAEQFAAQQAEDARRAEQDLLRQETIAEQDAARKAERAAESGAQARARRASRGFRAAKGGTILTSPLGVVGTPSSSGKSLLGE